MPTFPYRPTARALLLSMALGNAWAQDTEPALRLKADRLLQERLTPEQREKSPVFLRGERISGRPERDTLVEGQAELRRAGTVIQADRLEYDQPTDRATATGHVRINRDGNVYEGSKLDLKVEQFEGTFDALQFRFLQNDGNGQASRAEFINKDKTVVHDASYTTCRRTPGPDWVPDWILKATQIQFDNEKDEGRAQGGVVYFKDVPILPVPALSFPLSDRRRSGFLPPTLGFDNFNGSEIATPYYWNIAPNYDATLTPTIMTARGVDYGGELRYLEPSYTGALRVNYMPEDKLRQIKRWGLSLQHQGSVNPSPQNVGPIGVNLNINRVSDDDYWRDFTRNSSGLTQRLLPSEGNASWGRENLSASARVLKWQTLQDPLSPIIPPYDRVPQFTLLYQRANVQGWDWSVEGDYTQFESDRLKTLQPNAQRSHTLMQISRPWLGAGGFITPKLQLHSRAYQFDAPLANGERTTSRTVPTFSLDSGIVFERPSQWGSRNYIQTLEPRAFYVHTPYRNQQGLPNYDTSAASFNFASIFSEHSFVGHDKIADNRLLTLGLTSRLLEAETGAQTAQFAVTQRLRFEDQKTTLTPTDTPAEAGFSDVLLGSTVQVDPRWALDGATQYNVKTKHSDRTTVGARYSPGAYRVVNTAYRFQRAATPQQTDTRQTDLSWQWPLNGPRVDANTPAGRGLGPGRYYSVGRLSYDLDQRKMTDTLLGIEYDGGCWLGRVVLQRTQVSDNTATQSIMFQLEFVGFTRLGISPQRALTTSISRYQNLRESGTQNSRFSNYD